MHELPQELARLESLAAGPLDSILESLDLLGVPEHQWDDFITATLLALRGWSGMLFQMEVRGDRVPIAVPAGTLAEYLAVRLILERVALGQLARETLHYEGPLDEICNFARARVANRQPASNQQRAFLVFQLAQVLNWSPPVLFNLSSQEWSSLVAEIEGFSSLERRRLFQQTFERRLRMQALDAISIRSQHRPERVPSPAFQAVFCIALVHILGHACLRTLQFLRAPTLLLDYKRMENAIGHDLPHVSGVWEWLIPAHQRAWFSRLARRRGYLDGWLTDRLVFPCLRYFKRCDAMDRRWNHFLAGSGSRPTRRTETSLEELT